MSRYEFLLRQEALLEKGASALGDLYRCKRENRITEQRHPISVLYSLVWSAKQDMREHISEKSSHCAAL